MGPENFTAERSYSLFVSHLSCELILAAFCLLPRNTLLNCPAFGIKDFLLLLSFVLYTIFFVFLTVCEFATHKRIGELLT